MEKTMAKVEEIGPMASRGAATVAAGRASPRGHEPGRGAKPTRVLEEPLIMQLSIKSDNASRRETTLASSAWAFPRGSGESTRWPPGDTRAGPSDVF